MGAVAVQLCGGMVPQFLTYQGIISEFSLEAEGIFLNSLGLFFHQGHNPFSAFPRRRETREAHLSHLLSL